jgi:hypothetical protein
MCSEGLKVACKVCDVNGLSQRRGCVVTRVDDLLLTAVLNGSDAAAVVNAE